MRQHQLVVDTIPDPIPQPGEALVKTLACGICGSDLHALKHAEKLVRVSQESGTPIDLDLTRDVIMGHEFCAEVLEYGPQTEGPVRAGDRVVSMPLLLRDGRVHTVGYSNDAPGGYGELMTLAAGLLLPVPNGLATEHAALTEPMAVGLHAVEKAKLEPQDPALVVGCGPVGLAVIAALKLKRVEPIIAADFSPLRRTLATRMGAHQVIDPGTRPAIDAFVDAAGMRPAVIFECVGVPGMLRQVMRDAPVQSRIIVAGVCMEDDVILPIVGINKELQVQFVLGYTPDEFAGTLRAIAEGEIEVAPLITGRVDVAGVPAAFETLARPDAHAKILVQPWRT
jgi:threonine dehydrogenase-like Zn-dependent dehydrogenase